MLFPQAEHLAKTFCTLFGRGILVILTLMVSAIPGRKLLSRNEKLLAKASKINVPCIIVPILQCDTNEMP
jgi:hypothetical protein